MYIKLNYIFTKNDKNRLTLNNYRYNVRIHIILGKQDVLEK